ncbi:hypothetical protein RB594_000677 [Gaeumannomyces avenae]
MWPSSLLSRALLGGLVAGQTPARFTPSVSKHLNVVYGSKAVKPPGTSFTKAETARIPTFGLNETLTGTYLFIMIDLDVQLGTGGARQPLLHAMIRDVKATGQTHASGFAILGSTQNGPSSYFGPSPPAERPPYPHSYVFLLYEQPAGFAVPASQRQTVSSRFNFNIAAFAQAANLTVPLAGNYLNVTGV